MADRRRVLILAGAGLLGFAGLLWLEGQHPAATTTTPPPKPPPAPPPPGITPPPPKPPPPPVPAKVRGYQTVGHYPNWDGTLWGIAAHWYGAGAQYPRIYTANAPLIESVAHAHGLASSEAGHWIFPGTRLKIPA